MIKLLSGFIKFVYLNFLDDYKKVDARNYISNKIERLRLENIDGSRKEEIEDHVELYKWMCINGRKL